MCSRRAFNFSIWSLIFVSELRRRQFMKKRKVVERLVATPGHLDELIEETPLYCHENNEPASGF